MTFHNAIQEVPRSSPFHRAGHFTLAPSQGLRDRITLSMPLVVLPGRRGIGSTPSTSRRIVGYPEQVLVSDRYACEYYYEM